MKTKQSKFAVILCRDTPEWNLIKPSDIYVPANQIEISWCALHSSDLLKIFPFARQTRSSGCTCHQRKKGILRRLVPPPLERQKHNLVMNIQRSGVSSVLQAARCTARRVRTAGRATRRRRAPRATTPSSSCSRPRCSGESPAAAAAALHSVHSNRNHGGQSLVRNHDLLSVSAVESCVVAWQHQRLIFAMS